MQTIEAETDRAVDLPQQSQEDGRWGFHVGDIVQIAQGCSKKYTYALYYGQGRVIHVWSPSRRSFRVRVDSLRSLKASGYVATNTSGELDGFFDEMLNITPIEPKEAIKSAKTVLHATTASRLSNLSFLLFARYGEAIIELLRLFKEAYCLVFDDWISTNSCNESLQVVESPLDLPVRLVRSSHRVVDTNAIALSTHSAIRSFFGSIADLMMSEWLHKALDDFCRGSCTKGNWHSVSVPSMLISNAAPLAPLLLQFNTQERVFQVRCGDARGLPQRMAEDRMECGVCWMDFTLLKIMLLKCEHYICDPCFRLLPRQECPYCRGSAQNAQPVGEFVKREALRLVKQFREVN